MTLDELNRLTTDEVMGDLLKCCGARRWAEQVAARRPYPTPDHLFRAADEAWNRMEREDLLEAFTHHPKIGDIESLRRKFASTANWASGEQSGVSGADESVLQGLAAGNAAYEAKFGFIFIVCATGKTAAQMLEMLRTRLENDPARELGIAAEEQRKITRIRLEKLLSAA